MAKKKREASIVRSSAAEHLTFVAATGGQNQAVEMRYQDENLWLTQKMMATLYDVTVPAINQHIKRIFADQELEPAATIKKYLIVQTEGSRQVQREVDHYSLQAIIAVGFKIENERAVQFRKWASQIVKDYTIQGWVMDVERLKSGGSVLTNEFFERQLEKVREVRLSERKFYQKITDIYATALDYDPSAASPGARPPGPAPAPCSSAHPSFQRPASLPARRRYAPIRHRPAAKPWHCPHKRL